MIGPYEIAMRRGSDQGHLFGSGVSKHEADDRERSATNSTTREAF